MVRGRSPAVAVTNATYFSIFNPSATQRVRIMEIYVVQQAAPGAAGLQVLSKRTINRGTPGSTVTPAIQNHSRRGVNPGSGLLLDLAPFSVDPNDDGGNEGGPSFSPLLFAGAEIVDIRAGNLNLPLVIPPGTGFKFWSGQATSVGPLEVSVGWEEDW